MPNIGPFRTLRFRLGDLQSQELASLLGVSVPTLSQVENGNYPAKPWKVIESLRDTFGWTLDECEAFCLGTLPEDRLNELIEPLPGALLPKVRKKLAQLLKARAAA